MEALVAHFGYLALLIGVLLEGEAVLVVAGALAHRGDLALPLVILIAFGGSVAGDQAWFHFGRRYGARRLGSHAATVERWLARYGTALVVGFRFLYGMRTATPVLLGAAGYPIARFAVLNAVGAALWATTFGLLGYAIGTTVEAVLRRAGRIEELALAAIGVALLSLLIRSRLAKRGTQRAMPA